MKSFLMTALAVAALSLASLLGSPVIGPALGAPVRIVTTVENPIPADFSYTATATLDYTDAGSPVEITANAAISPDYVLHDFSALTRIPDGYTVDEGSFQSAGFTNPQHFFYGNTCVFGGDIPVGATGAIAFFATPPALPPANGSPAAR